MRTPPAAPLFVAALFLAAACTPLDQVGRAPEFSPLDDSFQHAALYASPMPEDLADEGEDESSLWTAGRDSLFGDRRANRSGDILTVVIEIDDSAEIKNSTGRDRAGAEKMGIGSLFGLPQRIDQGMPEGGDPASDLVATSSTSTFAGSGSVKRNEKLTLRVAATVVEELPNGVLRIEGQQEVRVNYELRELIITGYVRPIDISRQNEITYDKIAGARISYGGRGLISTAQQPRYGQQITDIVSPF